MGGGFLFFQKHTSQVQCGRDPLSHCEEASCHGWCSPALSQYEHSPWGISNLRARGLGFRQTSPLIALQAKHEPSPSHSFVSHRLGASLFMCGGLNHVDRVKLRCGLGRHDVGDGVPISARYCHPPVEIVTRS